MNWTDRGRRIVLVAACLCIALNGYMLLRRDAFGWNLAKALRDPNEVMHTIGPVDRIYADVKPNENTFLGFQHFTADNEHLAEVLYYRSSYVAYPAKVYVAPPGTVINSSKDFFNALFEPGEQWLDEHRVFRTVVYDQKPNGNVKGTVTAREIR